MILPVAKQWGGGPLEERWRGRRERNGPSTMLRMVPLSTGFAGREELK
jgi:hypothetical protein